jgi:hypothetical protein
MFKEVMNDLWLARISSLSNEVGLYVVLLEVLLFMPNDYRSVLYSFGISTIDEELDLPSLYWIPKLHKCPFKQCYIAGLSNALRNLFPNHYSIGGQNWASELL